MDVVDPLKTTKRLQAQRNANKVRTQPYDYVGKSVGIMNKKEEFHLEKRIEVMDKYVKLATDNIVRDKKNFVEDRRKNLREVVPGLKKDFLQRSGQVRDSELLQIVQYYEVNNPKAVKHSQTEIQRPPKKTGKLKPLNKPMSISLQDLSAISQHNVNNRVKGLKSTSKLQILAENLPVAHFKYSTRDGHSDMEKESLRQRKMGVISCPAFYLETGGRGSSMSRETPMKVHSSLEMHEQLDDTGLPYGAAALLLGPNSRAASRVTNRYETATPAMKGHEGKLSMHHDKMSNPDPSTMPIDGKVADHALQHPPSTFKNYIANNKLQVNDEDLPGITSPSTDRSNSFRGYGGKKYPQSQGSANSNDTLAASLSTRSSIPTPINTPKDKRHSSGMEFPITEYQSTQKRTMPQSTGGKPYHLKPQTEPSAGVTEILDKHLHPVQPRRILLPKLETTAIHGDAEASQGVKCTEDKGISKRKTSPKKLYKNDRLISTFLVPSDVKKLCSEPFDPYILAVNEGEISELGTKQREKETENRLKIQKEFYKTAQGNVQHWISDVDDQMKKDRLKYITDF